MRAPGETAGAETDGEVAIGAAGAAVFGGAAGVTNREGALVAGALETGAAGRAAGAAGFASCAGGGAGREEGALGAVAVPCCLARIAFSTSPGLDMWERSILGLTLSASGRAARADLAL